MKTRILLATIGAAALAAITINVSAGEALLTPRDAGNQIKHFAGTNNDPNLVKLDYYTVTVSPRAAGNQRTTVAGTNTEVTPAAVCAKNMTSSPKAIQACIESGTMAGCSSSMTVAPLK